MNVKYKSQVCFAFDTFTVQLHIIVSYSTYIYIYICICNIFVMLPAEKDDACVSYIRPFDNIFAPPCNWKKDNQGRRNNKSSAVPKEITTATNKRTTKKHSQATTITINEKHQLQVPTGKNNKKRSQVASLGGNFGRSGVLVHVDSLPELEFPYRLIEIALINGQKTFYCSQSIWPVIHLAMGLFYKRLCLWASGILLEFLFAS